jgi:hypothetical protein
MALTKVGSVYADDGKKKGSGGNLVMSLIIGIVFLYYWDQFLGWW